MAEQATRTRELLGLPLKEALLVAAIVVAIAAGIGGFALASLSSPQGAAGEAPPVVTTEDIESTDFEFPPSQNGAVGEDGKENSQ